jgi:tetratricopeptide (TPR) repeat protein
MKIGDIVDGRFEVEDDGIAGGMGVIHKARDRVTGERVALKLVRCSSPEAAARFAREARVLSELSHPNIVRYVAHGTTAGGDAFLAMEWLDGEDLAHRLERKGLTMEESLSLLRSAADAIGAAHASGVVHRDVKPSNLFLRDRDVRQVIILDFGVARLQDESGARTATGQAIGTIGYMAPEQARGDKLVDARADVFALGCVLFECLTGRAAFQGEHAVAILAKILLEPSQHISAVRDDVPEDIESLVDRMMSKDPARRPADGRAVVEALAQLANVPVSQRTPMSSAGRISITGTEQQMVSVVVATSGTHAASLAPTLTPDEAHTRLEPMREAVRPFRARIEVLLDGSVVATLAGSGSATDQAATAARCALAMRARMPRVPMFLATGHRIVSAAVPLGDVIERAVGLVDAMAGAPADAGGRSPIGIDDVTAALLDPRFDVVEGAHGRWLRGERDVVEAPRTVLGKPTPCVGRDRELALLQSILDECASEPVSRAVVVTAPEGFGKSRLWYELVASLRAREVECEVWIGRGDALTAGSPFGMIVPALRRSAGVREGEPLEVRRDKVRSRVSRHVHEDVQRVTEFVGELLGVPFPDDASEQLRAARRDPMIMGDQMRRAWEDLVSAECAVRPLLLVLDDLHWADPPSVDLVGRVLRNLRERPFMVLAAARPEVHDRFPKLWGERDVQHVRLVALTRRAAERLVHEVLGETATTERTRVLVERADGNALYLEELMRAAGRDEPDELPQTVLAMVEARLEALDAQSRRVLRAASIFGPVFWEGGARALLGGDSATQDMRGRLGALVERELVAERSPARFAGEREYAFRQALVRDAAYAMLTENDRRLGHELAARWLERAGEQDAIVIADHYASGGQPTAAVPSYARAAAQALSANDLDAVQVRVEQAVAAGASGEQLGELRLAQAEALRWRGQWREAQAKALEALGLLSKGTTAWWKAAGEVIIAAGNTGDDAVVRLLATRVDGVAARAEARSARVEACARLVVQQRAVGNYEAADEVFASIENSGHDASSAAWIARARANAALIAGRPADYLRSHANAAVGFHSAGDLRNEASARSNIGNALKDLGRYEEAEGRLREAMAIGERLGLHHVVAVARHNLGYVLARRGKLAEARAQAMAAVDAMRQQGDRRGLTASHAYLAAILLALGDGEGGLEQARAAEDVAQSLPTLLPLARAAVARAELACGRPGVALDAAQKALADLEAVGGRVMEGEEIIRLTYAEALEAVGDHAGAAEAIARAHARLAERANAIDDPVWRESFERIAENARIVELAQAWRTPGGAGAPPNEPGG